MKSSIAVLKAEIERELKSLEKLGKEMDEILRHPQHSFLETRAAGSILHDFYSGIEKIFKRIATRIDKNLPTGDDWHSELLIIMSIPIDGLRPAVISEEMKEQLAEYLRFRHLFRNIYGFQLKWDRCETLGILMVDLLEQLKKEIFEFLKFLDTFKEIS